MSKLYDWSEYLKAEFGLEVRFATPDSEDWAKVQYHFQKRPNAQPKGPLGLYFPGQSLTVIRHELWGKLEGFHVLMHEFGHHLSHMGKLGYKDNKFVKDFWKEVPKSFVLWYPPEQRQEELVVECFARWAEKEAKEHYLYGDLIGGTEVDNSFAEFLISMGANPPPPF